MNDSQISFKVIQSDILPKYPRTDLFHAHLGMSVTMILYRLQTPSGLKELD